MLTTKEDYAYAAGIIDGEGTINLQHHKKKGNVWYTLRVIVGSTDKELIRWLHMHFGGWTRQCYDKRANRKPVWQWYIIANSAKDFLVSIADHLLIKYRQALLAIIFQEERKRYWRTNPRYKYQLKRQLIFRSLINAKFNNM